MIMNVRIRQSAFALLAGALLLAQTAQAQSGPSRIIVLPFYTEEGVDVRSAGSEVEHFRRIIRFINYHLARSGSFEVINAHAVELKEKEYSRLQQTAREDSLLAAQEMTRKYAVDIAYIVWVEARKQMTGDGYCRARVRVEGEGYDSASRVISAVVSETVTRTMRDCRDAIVEAEEDVGDEVGRTLIAWYRNLAGSAGGGTTPGGGGGVGKDWAKQLRNLINMRLEGVTRPELVGVFGRVLNTVRGATEATLYRTVLRPGNPQASLALWRVRIEDTDTFRLQENVMTMLMTICKAGGQIVLNGVKYRYEPAEIDLLKGIRPRDVTTREIVFIVDRAYARKQEMGGVECG